MSAMSKAVVVVLLGGASICGMCAAEKAVYCKYCGRKAASVKTLTANKCLRHPNGAFAGPHALYEGTEKAEYVCKYCGNKAKSIQTLTANKCLRHPNGAFKGMHVPAL